MRSFELKQSDWKYAVNRCRENLPFVNTVDPLLSDRVAARMMKLARHCHRHREIPASKLVLWEPNDGSRRPGGQTLTLCGCTQEGCRSEHPLQAGCMDEWKD